MKYIIFCPFFLFSIFNGYSQNLVTNPSFEDYLDCPWSSSEFELQVNDWYSFALTPDYFNICNNSSSGFVGIPNNAWGHQFPLSGDAYAGLITYTHTTTNEREYIASQLATPLVIGETYYVMFFASLYDGGNLESFHCATNHLGIKFFEDPPYSSEIGNWLTPPNNSDIEYEGFITDTAEWVLVQGYFTANEEHNWMVLGNFYNDQNTSILPLASPESCYGIYYIDNVCVSTDPADCDYLLSYSLNDSRKSSIKLWPNPAVNSTIIESPNHFISHVQIFSTDGASILNMDESSNQIEINTSHWAKGMYFIRILLENGKTEQLKLLKQ